MTGQDWVTQLFSDPWPALGTVLAVSVHLHLPAGIIFFDRIVLEEQPFLEQDENRFNLTGSSGGVLD